MLKLDGKLINVFQSPEGKNKDGGSYGGEWRVQLQAESHLKNGQKRVELINLTVPDQKQFIDHTGKDITVDVGVFARSNGLFYFLPENYSVVVNEKKPFHKV